MTPWLLISGDFTPLGGMDYANHALAKHLASRPGAEVHLVAHRAWYDLAALAPVKIHSVWRPLNSHLAGMPLLRRSGRRWARRLTAKGTRVVVNGGNCEWYDVTWVHYVHAAYCPRPVGSPFYRIKSWATHHHDRAAERRILTRARTVICNSWRTYRDVVERVGVPEARAHVVYYGVDPERFALITPAERADARAALGWGNDQPIVAFVGALGDRRKGFDTLFAAWKSLCSAPNWDCRLAVVGSGAELPAWKQRARQAGMAGRIHFLGFRKDVQRVLAASDLLVHPARYEAYGLGVHEALCRGLPALVSAEAGVAERYPPELKDLLLPDAGYPVDLVHRLRHWRKCLEAVRAAVLPLSNELREYSWDTMAERFVHLVESAV